jgi:hypothetical protein
VIVTDVIYGRILASTIVVAQGAGSNIIKAALGDGKLAEYFGQEEDLVDFEPIGFVVMTLDDKTATMSES